ncbi:polygalacturonase-like [Aristolochia californica]|uniref:polygalacturonase-like n=1 Tax=Aristolochia californica TaxID=171875 RepID=UPI0035E31231
MDFFLLPLLLLFPFANGAYNVVNYGAKGDGETDSTRAFLSAWSSACGSTKPATIYVPAGRYLIKKATFGGPCRNNKISFKIDGTLIATTNYAVYGKENWLLFTGVKGVSITGGTLDGKGAGLWACKAAQKNCPDGAKSLTFNNCQDITIDGLKSINSQLYHIGFNGCRNVNVRGVQLVAPDDSPNTDGIHVQLSTGVTIINTGIKTGDDCISIGPGTRNLWVERVACGPGHGISIGSLAKDLKEEGVSNVTVKSAVFTGTDNGLRIKSWGRVSNGFVRDVNFLNAVMVNVKNPIIIDQNYCPRNENCPGEHSGVKISGVRYENIKGTSATKVAVKFDCSKANPCNAIGLQDVKLTYQNQRAASSCKNARGASRGLVEPPSCL